MTYTIETTGYNESRYGRPWIAAVVGKDFQWGQWSGRNGEAGELTIDAESGALIAMGQKDLRKGRGGVDQYYIAMPNGKLYTRYMSMEIDARKAVKQGWQAYAERYMRDADASSNARYAMARMLGVQCPLDAIVADAFRLTATETETKVADIGMDAFGL